MVVLTGAAVAVIASGGLVAVTGSAAGSAVSVIGTVAVGSESAMAVGTAVGAGVSTGAIAGAGTAVVSGATGAGVAAGAGVGAVSGGLAAAGVQTSAISGGALASGVLTGGLGFLVVGTNDQPNSDITYNCWKPVIHDESEELSGGMILNDLLSHENVAKVSIRTGCCHNLPNIWIENIWQEEFEIEYYLIKETNTLVCHARSI